MIAAADGVLREAAGAGKDGGVVVDELVLLERHPARLFGLEVAPPTPGATRTLPRSAG